MAIFNYLAFNLLLISILTSFLSPSNSAILPNDAVRNQIRGQKLSASETGKNLKNAVRVESVRDCGEMGNRSECAKNPSCRWCQSDSVDDTCFSKSEALRLPVQVFSCES